MRICTINNFIDLEDDSAEEKFISYKRNIYPLILTIKVIVALLYAFGLGYSLFFFGETYLQIGLKFLYLLILAYIFIDFPLAFLKALLLPKSFNKDKITLALNPFNLSIDICTKIKLSKGFIIFSFISPFILFAIVPTILSYRLEFNLYLYLIASVNAIIGCKDLIYSFVILKNYSLGKTIKLTPKEIIFYK